MSVNYSAILGYGYLVPGVKIPENPEDYAYLNPDSRCDYSKWVCLNGYDNDSDWFCGEILADTCDQIVVPTINLYAFEHYATIANEQLSVFGLTPKDCLKDKPGFVVFLRYW